MTGPTHLNSELAHFFRSHAKNMKLSKDEVEYIDNLLFSCRSPAHNTLSLFPLTTALAFERETPSIISKYSSVPSTVLKSSRKRLDLVNDKSEFPKLSPSSNEEIANFRAFPTSFTNTVPVATNSTENLQIEDDQEKFINIDKVIIESEVSLIKNPHRQMTNAAKELMASICWTTETIEESSKKTNNLPVFEVQNPESNIPKFYFDTSEEKPNDKNIETIKPAEFLFHFDISEYNKSTNTKNHSYDQLPKFYFKID